MSDPEHDEGATFRIGAVARLAGVSVHTLRKWEERYGAVEPHRTEGGDRIYSRNDVERLALIKRLADAGLALRELARMPLERLALAWEEVAHTPAPRPREPVKAAILGSTLAALVARQPGACPMLDVAASGATADELQSRLRGPVDVLVFECPALSGDTLAAVRELMRRLDARAALVVYAFGARADVLALQAPEVATVRAPADLLALERAAVALAHPGVDVPAGAQSDRAPGDTGAGTQVPAPRLSREVVARVARTSPRMRCECPHHLADIILGLRAFEEYSAQCESRNPQDAQLHHYLWRSTAHARALFEEAIERVALAEGISLDE